MEFDGLDPSVRPSVRQNYLAERYIINFDGLPSVRQSVHQTVVDGRIK